MEMRRREKLKNEQLSNVVEKKPDPEVVVVDDVFVIIIIVIITNHFSIAASFSGLFPNPPNILIFPYCC